jgi:methylaspartate mutase epsilon subunit
MARPYKNNYLPSFDGIRSQVLGHPKLEGVIDNEVREYLAGMQDECFASVRFSRLHHSPYIQPRGGYATFDRQQKLTKALSEAGADFLPLTIDSYTRHNDYDRAQLLLEKSLGDGKDYLNGYPLVNHGFEITRLLFTDLNKPVSLRHGTPDARVLVEMAIASGITEIEGGGISYCLPYSMNYPLDRALLNWQYIDRLAAQYSTPERPIHREFFGPLTGTMVPPAMMIAVSIIELLLAAEQGVCSATVAFSQTGSFFQDVATANVFRKFSAKYLQELGFTDMKVYLAYHHWMGAFPPDRRKADYLIACASLTAKIIGADKVITKTRDEAWGIPSIQANVEAIQETNYVMSKFISTSSLNSPNIERESQLIAREARSIIDAVLDMPGNNFWYSVNRAVHMGIIDIPFAPNLANRNRLLTVRDGNLAIRIKSAGSVPLDDTAIEEERALLQQYPSSFISTADQMLGDINVML